MLTTEERVPPEARFPEVRDQVAVKFLVMSETVLTMVSLAEGFTCSRR